MLKRSLQATVAAKVNPEWRLYARIANYDHSQHAENENIRLQSLWDGIEIFASLMTMKE